MNTPKLVSVSARIVARFLFTCNECGAQEVGTPKDFIIRNASPESLLDTLKASVQYMPYYWSHGDEGYTCPKCIAKAEE
jgi:hypothetical protein